MNYKKYKVTCEQCKGSDILTITEDRNVFYTEHTPIIAARYRPDMAWGFQCMCGQDSRVAPQEKDQLSTIVKSGGEDAIKAIAKSLTPKNELKFRIEPA